MAIKRLPSTGDAPRSTGVPESLVAGGPADSAGIPWEGRTFDHHGTAFADDDGETPEAIARAVAQLREAATQTDPLRLAEAHTEVILALSQSRLLIPLVAEAGDIGVTPEGRTVEKTQELSIVTVAAPDGRRVMPVFTSVARMQHWNPTARPIPVPGPQVAVAAGQEVTDLLIVDAATADAEFGVRRPMLEGMALGEPELPSWADDGVQRAFAESVASEPLISAVHLAPGDPQYRLIAPEVDVVLMLTQAPGREDLTELLARLQERWQASSVIASRVDSLRVVPRVAEYNNR